MCESVKDKTLFSCNKMFAVLRPKTHRKQNETFLPFKHTHLQIVQLCWFLKEQKRLYFCQVNDKSIISLKNPKSPETLKRTFDKTFWNDLHQECPNVLHPKLCGHFSFFESIILILLWIILFLPAQKLIKHAKCYFNGTRLKREKHIL